MTLDDEVGEETPPPSKKKKPKVSSPDTLTEQTPVEFDEDDLSTADALGTKKLKKKLAVYTEEYHFLSSDASAAGLNRKVVLSRIMRVLQDLVDAREEVVEVTVPSSPTGHPYVVGPLTFNPGVYKIRGGIAGYLLWMIGSSQQVELQRLQQNGRTVDLGTIGDRAKQIHAAITRE
jgi:hypothetical protein